MNSGASRIGVRAMRPPKQASTKTRIVLLKTLEALATTAMYQYARLDGEVIANEQPHPGEQVAAVPEAWRPFLLALAGGRHWRLPEQTD